jgi:hypothetical protein
MIDKVLTLTMVKWSFDSAMTAIGPVPELSCLASRAQLQ